jgi:lysophospholipase L1-like esterase
MLKKISLAIASTVACVLLAEVVVRVLGLAPGVNRIQVDMPYGSFESSSNAVLRYVPRPGSPGINAYGIRDHEYPLQKPASGLRILVIGDSVGYGFCNDREVLAVDSVFPKQLERMLRQSATTPVEVINLCVSGYDTVQEVEFLVQKGLALHPDLVVVAYCLNDDFDASAELHSFQRNPQFGIDSVIAQRLVLKSHLLRLVWLRHWKPPVQPQREAVSRTERGFQRLVALAHEHRFEPVVVVFPLFEPLDTYRWHAQHARAAQLAARYGIPALDLLEPFAAASQGDLRRLQGRCNREHPDEIGHRVAAEAIQKFLADRGLIGTP